MKKNTKYDVVALGELLIDFTDNGKSQQNNPLMEANPGGAVCNVLSMLNKMDYKTGFIGKVGDDLFGNMLQTAIVKAGIDDAGLVKDKDIRTTLAFVHNDDDGDRHFSFYRKPGADMMLAKEEVNTSMLKDCKLFHFGSLSMTDEPCRSATQFALQTAKENGSVISFDPNLREKLWDNLDTAKQYIDYGLSNAEIVKISDNEIVWFTGLNDYDAGVKYIFDKYSSVKIVLLSLGKEGSMAYTRTIKEKKETFITEATIDTTGAGDTFMGTCLAYLLKYMEEGLSLSDLSSRQLNDMLTFANAAATIVTTKKGALMVMPERQDVQKLIDSVK